MCLATTSRDLLPVRHRFAQQIINNNQRRKLPIIRQHLEHILRNRRSRQASCISEPRYHRKLARIPTNSRRAGGGPRSTQAIPLERVTLERHAKGKGNLWNAMHATERAALVGVA